MLLPIPIGYFVSVFLLISGVLNCMEYLDNKPVNCTRAVLLNGLAEAGWPIIAATVILLLIQLNKQMEKLRLEATTSAPPLPGKPLKKKKRSADDAEPEEEARSSRKAAPAQQATPSVSLAGLARPAQVHAPMQPVAHSQAAAPAQHMPTYPNSPIPGGGRVPQPAVVPAAPVAPAASPAADLPPRPEPVPSTRSGKRAPSKSEAESLSFFKVD